MYRYGTNCIHGEWGGFVNNAELLYTLTRGFPTEEDFMEVIPVRVTIEEADAPGLMALLRDCRGMAERHAGEGCEDCRLLLDRIDSVLRVRP